MIVRFHPIMNLKDLHLQDIIGGQAKELEYQQIQEMFSQNYKFKLGVN